MPGSNGTRPLTCSFEQSRQWLAAQGDLLGWLTGEQAAIEVEWSRDGLATQQPGGVLSARLTGELGGIAGEVEQSRQWLAARGVLSPWLTGELAAIAGEVERSRHSLAAQQATRGGLVGWLTVELAAIAGEAQAGRPGPRADQAAHGNELALARAIEARFKEAYAGQ